MRALITGICGFVGSHLAEFLIRRGAAVGGVLEDNHTENIAHIQKQCALFDSDIRDGNKIGEIVAKFKPDHVYHLAAMSSVRQSLESSMKCFDVNIMGTLSLLEAVRAGNKKPRVLLVGSGEEYGPARSFPLTEDSPLNPITPYALSKACMETAGMTYYRSYAITVIRVRAFNHTGPRQSTLGVCSDFARQIAEIEAGRRKPLLLVGNLRARRDFSDVRDIVRGYWLAMTKGKPGRVYNLCSGKDYSIREVLNILFKMSERRIRVKINKDRVRPLDIPVLRGSYSRARKELGWSPQIPLKDTLEDLLNEKRGRISPSRSRMI